MVATSGNSGSDLTASNAWDNKKDEEPKIYGSANGFVDNGDDPDRKEPLVAYWTWKNKLTSHKLQMHLAKNSDLALHVVMAIVLNILKYERGVLYMKK